MGLEISSCVGRYCKHVSMLFNSSLFIWHVFCVIFSFFLFLSFFFFSFQFNELQWKLFLWGRNKSVPVWRFSFWVDYDQLSIDSLSYIHACLRQFGACMRARYLCRFFLLVVLIQIYYRHRRLFTPFTCMHVSCAGWKNCAIRMVGRCIERAHKRIAKSLHGYLFIEINRCCFRFR